MILLKIVCALSIFYAFSYGQNLDYLQKNNNSWLGVYSNSLKSQILDDEINSIQQSIKNAPYKKRIELKQLLELQKSKKKILDELPKSFDDILAKITVDKAEKEINLFEYIFQNRKYQYDIQIQKLEFLRKEYEEALNYLNFQLKSASESEKIDEEKKYQLTKAITFFEHAETLLDNKFDVLERSRDIYLNEIKGYKEAQLPHYLLNIGIIITIFGLFHILKYFITKRIDDEENLFKIKKIIDVTFFLSLLVVIIIFNITNIIYAATLIGFIAAAITITMKEHLQSLATWFHLIFGNFIRVGDRILVHFNNNPVIGEVIDISPFKVTLYESINNTTSMQLNRAGRIVFIPNNFFVNNYVYNYTHDKMKTIYDLVKFKIPFSEDSQKVEEIALEIAYELTEKYIEVSSKHFISLKNRYDMRKRDFRPRVHLIPDADGSCFILNIWYIAPYHQIMELKSQLSQKVVSKFKEEGIEFCNKSK
jgi:small-conductance mechanosensitive channel